MKEYVLRLGVHGLLPCLVLLSCILQWNVFFQKRLRMKFICMYSSITFFWTFAGNVVILSCNRVHVFIHCAFMCFFLEVDRYRRGFPFSKQSHFIREIKKFLPVLSNSFLSPYILHWKIWFFCTFFDVPCIVLWYTGTYHVLLSPKDRTRFYW